MAVEVAGEQFSISFCILQARHLMQAKLKFEPLQSHLPKPTALNPLWIACMLFKVNSNLALNGLTDAGTAAAAMTRAMAVAVEAMAVALEAVCTSLCALSP